MLAHVPSLGRNPRGSPDFLAYPVPKACMHVLGTRVSRCLGVARSPRVPKQRRPWDAALPPVSGSPLAGSPARHGLPRSVPRLWTLGFLLLRGSCVSVWVVVGFGFRLPPATPSWGVRRECVCLGSGFSRAPPLVAGVSGFVCACVRAPLAPRHSWLGCAAWVCVFGLGFRLRPATPGWGCGVCVCWCACSACTPPLLAGLCGGGVCVWAAVLAAPRHSWLGCPGVRVCVRAPLVPRLSWLGCAALVCVLGFGLSAAPCQSCLGCWGVCVLVCALHLYPATPGWGVRCGFGCLGSGFGCAPPLLAALLGCECAGMHASLVPRLSWLGCAMCLCVFVCALCLYCATPGWGVRCGCVCLGSGFGCAPPLLNMVLGCACLCACSPCFLPLLAGVCGVGVCAWARVSAAPRHSWLECWGVCVQVWALSLYPATLAAARGVGACVWVRVSAAPRHSWLGFWGVCVLVWALPLYPLTPDWGVRCGCGCLGSGLGCAPPALARVFGCVCAGVHAPLVPRLSWLGCAVCLCVFVCALRLYRATPGWGVQCGCVCLGSGFGCAPPLLAMVLGCACLCACSPCSLPLLAGLCGVRVCAWARVSAAPRHSWLRC